MDSEVKLSKIGRNGNSFVIVISRPLLAELVWRCGDRVAIRRHGDQLVIERIPLEHIARLRRPGVKPDAA